jgi:ABC-2 type transport system ATP-binding protein
MLAALIVPSSGSARVAGYALGKENDQIRRVVGILTETPGLYDHLSAWQNLIFFARLYGLDQQKAAAQVERSLHLLDLWERRNDRVGGFSKGMRQRLAIARALLHEPEVIFLDEPTAGLDPEAARTVREFIKILRSEGRTIFLTTHNLHEADELCDQVGIFRTRLLRVDTPTNLRVGMFERGTLVRVAGSAEPWVEVTRALPFVGAVSASQDRLTVRLDDPEYQNPLLIRTLITAGAQVRYVEALSHSLEEVYLGLIDAGQPEQVQEERR